MAVDNASLLREQLHEILNRISPSPAPVGAVLRKAAVRRTARRALATAGIVAGLAAAVTALVVLPGADRGRGPVPAATRLPGGRVLIGHGTVGGRPWRVVADPADHRVCAGVAGLRRSCAAAPDLERLTGLASLSGTEVTVPSHYSSFGPPLWNSVYGIVRPDVTRIDFKMSNGPTISVRPVAAAGHRWIGLVFRDGVVITRATAYAGATELAYSVPFIGGDLRAGTYFLSWLHPGQRGPAHADRYFASGGPGGRSWNALILAGQFGYCATLEVMVTNGARQDCWSVSSLRSSVRVIMRWGAASAQPRWIVGTARPAVAYLRLYLAGGGTARVRVTEVSGQNFYAMQIGPGPRILRWGAFDVAGHRLYGGRGAPDAGLAS